jgi:excisionase family DNA binding protein
MKRSGKRAQRNGMKSKPRAGFKPAEEKAISDLPVSKERGQGQHRPNTLSRDSDVGRLLGVDELAILFRCSTEKIKRLARAGELPAFKFGKSWFVREQDLERYIDRGLASRAQR